MSLPAKTSKVRSLSWRGDFLTGKWRFIAGKTLGKPWENHGKTSGSHNSGKIHHFVAKINYTWGIFSRAMLTEPGWVDWELAKYSVTFDKSTSTIFHVCTQGAKEQNWPMFFRVGGESQWFRGKPRKVKLDRQQNLVQKSWNIWFRRWLEWILPVKHVCL